MNNQLTAAAQIVDAAITGGDIQSIDAAYMAYIAELTGADLDADAEPAACAAQRAAKRIAAAATHAAYMEANASGEWRTLADTTQTAIGNASARMGYGK